MLLVRHLGLGLERKISRSILAFGAVCVLAAPIDRISGVNWEGFLILTQLSYFFFEACDGTSLWFSASLRSDI